jgi:hypothetical protein
MSMAKKKDDEINLANLTADRYKIALEETWHHEDPEVRSRDRIWFEQIASRGGAFISVYSFNPLILKLWTPRPKKARMIWEAIKGAAGVRADFHFDGEAEIYFPLESLPQVAELAGARRRRRLSQEERAKLAEVGKAHQFKPKNYGANGEENRLDLGDHS